MGEEQAGARGRGGGGSGAADAAGAVGGGGSPGGRRETIAVGDLEISYYRWRAPRPAVLFIHGITGYGGYWSGVAQHLRGHFDIIAPDMRGHGRSSKPGHGYSLEQTAADVLNFLDVLGVEQCAVAGHSWGGKVAALAAARHPGRFTHYFGIDPANLRAVPLEEPYRTNLIAYLDTLYGPHPSFDDAERVMKKAVEGIPGRSWGPQSRAHLRLALQPRPDGSWVGNTPNSVVHQVIDAIETTDVAEQLLGSSFSGGTTFAVVRSRLGEFEPLCRRLADCRVEPFDTSHWIPSDAPEELARLIYLRA